MALTIVTVSIRNGNIETRIKNAAFAAYALTASAAALTKTF